MGKKNSSQARKQPAKKQARPRTKKWIDYEKDTRPATVAKRPPAASGGRKIWPYTLAFSIMAFVIGGVLFFMAQNAAINSISGILGGNGSGVDLSGLYMSEASTILFIVGTVLAILSGVFAFRKSG